MGERLSPARQPPKTIIILEVPDGSNLDKLVGALAGAINRHADAIAKPGSSLAEALKTSGSNSEVLTALNNLTRKVDDFMATQEERLRGVKTKLDAIQSGIDKIQQQLADLKTNNPALEDEIAAIEATAAAIDTDVNPVVEPPPPPPDEPPV